MPMSKSATPLETYNGIVVARREAGDTGCYLDILTDEFGIVEASAHGVKKMNSALMSCSQVFSYAKFCFSGGKRRTVNSAKPIYSFHQLGGDIVKLALASYFAQAVRFCTMTEQTGGDSESIVRLLAISLFEILKAENEQRLEQIRAAFELRFTADMGFRPDLRGCDNCGCYEHEEFFFLPEQGRIFCGGCFDRDYDGGYTKLTAGALSAMRNIIYAPLDRCFKYTADSDDTALISHITEHYFLSRSESGENTLRRKGALSALEYYKGIRLEK